MRQEIGAVTRRKPLPWALVITHSGALLSLLGVLVACGLMLSSKLSVPIPRPLILALGPLVLLLRWNVPWLIPLRQIVCLYLVAILFNEVHLRYVSFVVLSRTVSVSLAVGPLTLCILGFVLGRTPSRHPSSWVGAPGLWYGWIGTAAVVLAHAVVLALVLHKLYGYGYEHTQAALGHLSMYIVLFAVLYDRLAERWFSGAVGVLVAVSYTLNSIL